MSFELIRIDERLLHGQVVVGWGGKIGLAHYVVADDDLADASWEQELYMAGLSEDADALFLTVAECGRRFDELEGRPGPGALLTRGTEPMRRLAEAGLLAGREVNVGFLGASEGRQRVAEYLHLAPEEREDLRVMAEEGAELFGMDLPTGRRIPAARLLEETDGP